MSKFINKVVTGFATIAMAVSMLVLPVATNVHAATAGGVYKTTDGTVWFVTENMTRRPFTSWGAFQSYGFLSAAQIMEADASVTALSEGSFIAPQDGRIFCATATKGTDVSGECSLITGGMKAAFTSASVFTGQGFSFARAFYGDSSFLTKTSNIDNASAQHRPGTLINNNGTVQLVVTGGLWGVPSMDVFNSWGWSFSDVVPANSADVLLSQTGVIPARQAGQLVPTATTDPDPGSGDCNVDGDAGDITLTLLSTYSAEDVGEGDEEVPVLGVDIEADDGSDVGITSIKVELEQNTAADSQDITDYVDEVVILQDGEVVGSADAEDFTEGDSDRYSKSIALDDCAVIDSGETSEFVVAITALNSLDSGDIDDDAWDVEIDQVRYVDGDDVTTTNTPAANDIDQTFDFDSFADASSIEMRTALNNTEEGDAINLAHVIDIDDTDETDDVEILAFTIEADGDSGLNIQEIPATVTTSVADESTIIQNAQLWYGGDSIATATIADGGALVFEDLDVDIDADETAEFTITVDIQDTGDAELANADTVQASLTAANADAIVAEDDAGDRIADGDSSGSAVGGTHADYDAGIMVEFVSASAIRTLTADAAAEIDQGNFKITFEVTAFDGNMYIDRSMDVATADCAAEANAAGQGTEYCFNTDTADDLDDQLSAVLESTSNHADDIADAYFLVEGVTRTFTANVTTQPDADTSAQMVIESINWIDETTAEAAGGVIDADFVNYYNFNLNDFRTGYLFMNVF